jgi:hydroxymethylglutaryl-CoA synthase
MARRRDESVGISDIRLHVPSPMIDLQAIVARRVAENPRMERHLERAVRVTGQKAIRFPEIWQDTATMAAQAALDLLQGSSRVNPESLRHLAVGTESGVDHSKPVSAYMQGMLQRAGVAVPASLSSFQSQHACAGGTVALLSVAGLLAAGGRRGDSGLVVASDIARYEAGSTAEMTQGAGAAALHVESSPRLLEIDMRSVGFHSRDVDDFFRPLGSPIAQVKGSYSMKCYGESLEEAFLDHCARSGERPERALLDTDFFVLHTPFRNMPETALEKLFEHRLGFTAEQSRQFLEERGFYSAVDPLARIGNIYTGSMYAVLAFLLEDRLRAMGEKIVGKRILFASYGSGNTMMVFSARIAADAPRVISRWNLARVFDSARTASFQEYQGWVSGQADPEIYARIIENAALPPDAFFLAGVRGDGYRDYRKAEEIGSWVEEREAPVDLPQPVAVFG